MYPARWTGWQPPPTCLRTGPTSHRPAGNSIGGYTVLSAAAQYPQVAKAVVLLNAAGRCAGPGVVVQPPPPGLLLRPDMTPDNSRHV